MPMIFPDRCDCSREATDFSVQSRAPNYERTLLSRPQGEVISDSKCFIYSSVVSPGSSEKFISDNLSDLEVAPLVGQPPNCWTVRADHITGSTEVQHLETYRSKTITTKMFVLGYQT
jgi:hypothetical protein